MKLFSCDGMTKPVEQTAPTLSRNSATTTTVYVVYLGWGCKMSDCAKCAAEKINKLYAENA